MSTAPIRLPPPFIGDLSTQDAAVLATIAKDQRVLEFGAGGSTQVFAAVALSVVCFETDGDWIARTQRNLERLGRSADAVRFEHYDLAHVSGTGPYDVIFVDGEPSKREAFARAAWPELGTGGLLVFHDDRTGERDVVMRVASDLTREICEIYFDVAGSNLAMLRKLVMPRYENWNVVETRESWEHGGNEDVPEAFLERIVERTARHFALEYMVPVLR